MSKSESVDQWKIVHKLLDYHIDRTCNGQSPDFQGSGRSLLHNLIQQNADKTEMRNQIIQGMMAAQDTTAILISNSIYLLSRHPHIWRRLRDEVATVDLAKIRVEDFRKLDLLRNTLYEGIAASVLGVHLG